MQPEESPKRYVFAYGSLLNPASMAKDIRAKYFTTWATLHDYERIFETPVSGLLALNIREQSGKNIDGMLIEADDKTYKALERREKGYSAVDVSTLITCAMGIPKDAIIYTFISAHGEYPDMHISQEYYDTCINAIPESLRSDWIATTIRNNPIV
jgi:cation transport regulator ChaC